MSRGSTETGSLTLADLPPRARVENEVGKQGPSYNAGVGRHPRVPRNVLVNPKVLVRDVPRWEQNLPSPTALGVAFPDPQIEEGGPVDRGSRVGPRRGGWTRGPKVVHDSGI